MKREWTKLVIRVFLACSIAFPLTPVAADDIGAGEGRPVGELQIEGEETGLTESDSGETTEIAPGMQEQLEQINDPAEDEPAAAFWKKPWFLAAGGAVGVGIIIALLGGGSDGGGSGTTSNPSSLDDFPDPPHE